MRPSPLARQMADPGGKPALPRRTRCPSLQGACTGTLRCVILRTRSQETTYTDYYYNALRTLVRVPSRGGVVRVTVAGAMACMPPAARRARGARCTVIVRRLGHARVAVVRVGPRTLGGGLAKGAGFMIDTAN